MILAVAIVVMIVKLLITLTDFTQFDQTDALNIFLGKAMTLAVETLIGVAAIAVLFAVRRYLFTDEDRENAH